MSPIINVRFKLSGPEEYSSQKYSYFCDLPVNVGDHVIAPTAKGDRKAIVVQVDMPPESVDAEILPKLRAITERIELDEAGDQMTLSVTKPQIEAAQELIIVKQLPVIEERLKTISEQIRTSTTEALALPCNEETVKQIKKILAAMNKDFEALEAQRKTVKKTVLAPYEEFEKRYRAYVTDVYSPAAEKIKRQIAEVESSLKDSKRAEVAAYFAEYAKAKGIDFITFEGAGITVNMSASLKSLKEQAKGYIERVAADLALIDTQEDREEIMVEYKKTMSASTAITTVKKRREAIDEERRRQEQMAAERELKEAAAKKVQQVVKEEAPAVAPPVATPVIPESADEPDEKKYVATFTVRASLPKLRELKEFLTKGGYEYESK